MTEIHYADDLEQIVGTLLKTCEIKFIHESQDPAQGLDFYLPDYGVYIEVKKFHADRVHIQMASMENVIVLQGRKAVEFLMAMLLKWEK